MVSAFSEAKDESSEVTFQQVDLSEDEENDKSKHVSSKSNGAILSISENGATNEDELGHDANQETEVEDEDEDVRLKQRT